jgi:hypothetical protein
VLRAHSVVAAGALLLAGVFLFPACTTTAEAGPGCTNGARDDGEDGIDCGGVCAVKCTGAACTSGDQCASGKCDNALCGAPDGKTCGVGVGSGTQCNDGEACELDKDCKTGFCDGGKCAVPSEESHSDGQRNGGETGVDCGGTVKATKPCPDGQGCSDSADCVGTCNGGTCGPIGPTDGKKNGDETDVDCGGGSTAPRCANGKACAVNGDCVDKYCPADKKRCVAPRNDDGVLNGTETDVDCGGTSGKKCAQGLICVADGDCNGACNYAKKCIDIPSCKPHLGGDTCGAGELLDNADVRETCCKTLPVPGFTDPARPGKAVLLDKYEITAGRVRAFIEDITAKSAGKPNVKAWIIANTPPIWSASWNMFLPTQAEGDSIVVPHNPSNNTETPPWNRDAGLNFQFNGQLFVYVHGHNTNNAAGSYGFPTFWLPPDVMAKNNGLPRRDAIVNGKVFLAKDYLDVKAATAIPNVMLAAFCHWDGGQLATDEVLDFVTASPPGLQNSQGCGTQSGGVQTGGRCAPVASINATSDSGQGMNLPYYYPYFADPQPTSEAASKIAAPGRMVLDVVKINAGDAEGWMDLHGNLEEAVLDVTGATFTGNFGLKYRGIGYNSSRAITNPTSLKYPEYKAGYTGGRCMRFK